jgi:hypothetical protein
MFEIGIFCVILFAIGYWATLFIMGRREDVLHGEFVEGEPELIAVPQAPSMPFPGLKPASRPTVVADIEAASPVVVAETAEEVAPIIEAPAPKPEHVAAAAPAPRPLIAMPAPNPERLQSLLLSIKQELKNASQI